MYVRFDVTHKTCTRSVSRVFLLPEVPDNRFPDGNGNRTALIAPETAITSIRKPRRGAKRFREVSIRPGPGVAGRTRSPPDPAPRFGARPCENGRSASRTFDPGETRTPRVYVRTTRVRLRLSALRATRHVRRRHEPSPRPASGRRRRLSYDSPTTKRGRAAPGLAFGPVGTLARVAGFA